MISEASRCLVYQLIQSCLGTSLLRLASSGSPRKSLTTRMSMLVLCCHATMLSLAMIPALTLSKPGIHHMEGEQLRLRTVCHGKGFECHLLIV